MGGHEIMLCKTELILRDIFITLWGIPRLCVLKNTLVVSN